METDVTYAMNAYRECARHLWNIFFIDLLDTERQWDIADEFEDICLSLFTSLVLNPIGCTRQKKSAGYERDPEPIPCLKVVPVPDLDSSSILINRDPMKASGYWDYPVANLLPHDMDLRFIDCFDFDRLGHKEFEFYLVQIVDSPSYPDIISRKALVRAHSVKVIFSDDLE